MIHWPAIIQYAGQAELAYVPDAAAWQAEAHGRNGAWHADDRLVDSRGEVYGMHGGLPQPTGQTLMLDAVLDLVRAHAAAQGLCCTAKLAAPSIADAIRLVATLHEED